jgi:glycosyltransferase involved in cell wall biosynthesis
VKDETRIAEDVRGGKPRRRITFLASTLVTGGAERMVREFALRLDREAFEPSIVCLNSFGSTGEEIASRGVPSVNGIMRSRHDPLALWRLRRALDELETELVVCLDHRNVIVLGAVSSLGTSRKVFVAVHSTRQWGGRRSLGWTTSRFLRFVDRVLAVGENQARYLSEEEGVAPEKIAIVPNGIELSDFDEMPSRDGVRASLDIPVDCPVVGIVAVLRPEKNHELFLEAAASVAERIEDVRFVIVGGGQRRELLEDMASRLGVSERTIFTGERRDGRRLFQAFDVAVLCSHPVVETLPLSLMEAMASSKPVVATNVGDVPSLVEDGETGFLVAPGSRDQLSGAIARLLEAPNLAAEMGRRGREKIAREFSIERSVKTLEHLIGERLKKRSG